MKIDTKLYWENARGVLGIILYKPVKWALFVVSAPFYLIGLALASASVLFLKTADIIDDLHSYWHGIIMLVLFPKGFIHAYKEGYAEGERGVEKFYTFANKRDELGFKFGRMCGRRTIK